MATTNAASIKAVGLLSGGLDSTLAARLLLDQGISVFAINFTSPFCTCTPKNASCASVIRAVAQLGNIPLKRVALGEEYLAMVRQPAHGYGRGMNPCIDCRILKIRKAHEYMREIGASFLFTGEVLGQRPMSQHRRAIELIDRSTGLGDITLRPLSAHYFPPTLPERKGWVNRDKLLALSGRSRKPQIALAGQYSIIDYPCPAGGCRLTDPVFAERLRDYFEHTATPRLHDVRLLGVGRYFRIRDKGMIVVARNENEGNRLRSLAGASDHLLEPLFSGPVTLFQGSCLDEALELLLHYALPKDGQPLVVRHKCGEEETIIPIPEAVQRNGKDIINDILAPDQRLTFVFDSFIVTEYVPRNGIPGVLYKHF